MTESNTAPTTERRAFKVHRDILWSIVRSQAGTLSKAILELVMNAVDAGSSKVNIELSTTALKVTDDGKGFTNREEIEQFFETFGTPHKAGDAVFGKFRMGRGMVMSFTCNTWRSGEFKMFVNIRDLGLEYDLSKLDVPAKGCTIEGTLYDPLEASGLIRLIDELRTLCKYAPIPVYVNGERISQDLKKIKWTDEDEDAYYLIRDGARAMSVYNLGVFVRDFWRGEFGVCGLVVSKRQLEVNFARNDVLANQCEVFKRVKAKLKAYAKQDAAERPRNNEAFREMQLDKLLTGSFDSSEDMFDAIFDAKVITDYGGRHHSLDGLTKAVSNANGALVAAEDHSMRADKVQQNKLAVVVDPKTLSRASNLSLIEIIERIEANMRAFPGADPDLSFMATERIFKPLKAAISDLDEVGALIDESKKIIDPGQHTQEEKLILKVLGDLSWYFTMATEQPRHATRKIGVFESETLDGFTDGKRLVFVNRKFLKIGGCAGHMFRAFDALKALMLHEYLHQEDDSRGHGHPAEFYERFHDIMSDEPLMQEFSYAAGRLYLHLRRKSGARMRSGDLAALDMVLIDDLGRPKPVCEKDWIDQMNDTHVAPPLAGQIAAHESALAE